MLQNVILKERSVKMERKIFKIAMIAMLLVCVCATIASALSFSVTMTPSKKVVPSKKFLDVA